MIADDIVAQLYRQNGALAPLMASAHCVHVPFGIHGCDPKLDALLPQREDRVFAPWARPPFPTLVIVGDGPVSFTEADYRSDSAIMPQPPTPEVIETIRSGIESLRGREAIFVGHDENNCPDGYVWMVFAIKLRIGTRGLAVPSQWTMIAGRDDGYITHTVPEDWVRRTVASFPYVIGVDLKGMLDRSQDLVETSLGRMRLTPAMVSGRLLAVVATTFALMNCRNIESVATQPTRQMRRQAERHGGPRPFEVHHLHIKAMQRKADTGQRQDPSFSLALHWVRGHFKTYTAERPLLGRAVGTWWWTPHLAGDVHDGVVVKDYTVEA